MAHMRSNFGDTFKPGDRVLQSGIYDVLHDPAHDHKHQITCVYGERFPPCRACSDAVRFRLAIAAIHAENHKHFQATYVRNCWLCRS